MSGETRLELKPCPFCGNIIFDTFYWKGMERIQCPNEACPIHGYQMNVKDWNRRAGGTDGQTK